MQAKPLLWNIAVLILASCTSSQRPIEPSPTPATPSVDATPRTKPGITTWTLRPSPDQHRYTSVVVAKVAEEGTSAADSMTYEVTFQLSIDRGATPALLMATIESVALPGQQRQLQSSSDSLLPHSLSGHFNHNGYARIDSSRHMAGTQYPCGTSISVGVAAVQQAIFLPPLQLQTSTSWTDTVSSTVCTGLIPAQSTLIRTYRIMGETTVRGNPAITVGRSDRISLTGEGALDQHQVSVTSRGTGEVVLTVDAVSGFLLKSRGVHSTELVVLASGRRRIFHQHVETQITKVE